MQAAAAAVGVLLQIEWIKFPERSVLPAHIEIPMLHTDILANDACGFE